MSINSDENVTSVHETREDIPLKSGAKSSNWFFFSEDCLSGVKFINITFGTFTIIITAALLLQIYYGDYQVVPHGSVATDSFECSKIGTSILKKGGKSIDAAIASAFCLAVAAPHLTSLDGEGQILIYNHRIKLPPTVIDFSSANVISKKLPKLVLGLAYTHREYGTLPWKELVEPSAKLARNGYLVSKVLVEAVKKAHAEDLFGRLEPGQLLHHTNLSYTLDTIANIPEQELYSYIDIQTKPTESQALQGKFMNYKVFVPNLNNSVGPLFLQNLNEINAHNFTQSDTMRPEYVYRIAEVTQLFYKDTNLSNIFHEGTSTNVAVVDLEDNYVSLITGMYQLFGSGEMTSLGYVFDIHSVPKLPCSRIPLIMTDSSFVCGRRIISGASNVATAVQLVTSLLVGKEDATESAEAPRFYIYNNGSVAIEGSHIPSFNEDILKYFKALSTETLVLPEPYQSSNIVEKNREELSSHSDSRGGGTSSRF